MIKKIEESANYIKNKITKTPDIAIILGSGLGNLTNTIKNEIVIDYKDIPNFPTINVLGHEGKLVIGELGNKTVMLMKGRFHYYEGYDLETIALPIRVFSLLGIKNLLITNACGGISDKLDDGSIMIINDHLSFNLPSILRGPNYDEFGPRFVDMTNVYTPSLIKLAHTCADKLNIKVDEGVYAYFPGPMYETPAEIRALKIMGADAVGMSTVPEAIIARHCNMNILGISLITNKASGLGKKELSHSEVLEEAKKAETKLTNLVNEILLNW